MVLKYSWVRVDSVKIIAFLTPPFGWALFFLRGVAPPEITTRHMYLGVIPFISLQVLGVVLVYFYPQLALWLPQVLYR